MMRKTVIWTAVAAIVLLIFWLGAPALMTRFANRDQGLESSTSEQMVHISFAPAWKIGQTWRVEVFSLLEDGTPAERTWRFKVSDRTVMNINTIYTLEISSAGDPETFVAKLNNTDMTLVYLAHYKAGHLVNEVYPNDPIFFLDTEGARRVPLDFSPLRAYDLSLDQFNAPQLILNSEKQFEMARGSGRQSFELYRERFTKKTMSRLNITFESNVDGRKLMNFQMWESGKPWWTNSLRFDDEMVVSEGVLLE